MQNCYLSFVTHWTIPKDDNKKLGAYTLLSITNLNIQQFRLYCSANSSNFLLLNLAITALCFCSALYRS